MTPYNGSRAQSRAQANIAVSRDRVSVMSGKDVLHTEHSLHHRLLRSQGGPDTAANLILVSGTGVTGEHGWIHRNPRYAQTLGLIVPSYSSPELWPVWRAESQYWEAGWYLQIREDLEHITERAAIATIQFPKTQFVEATLALERYLLSAASTV